MLQSRRGFLIGAGSLLTTAFVSDARSFIRRTNQPLLASPEQIAQTLHWYDGGAEPEDGYTLTLGRWTMEPPPAPSWREFFITQGIPHKTEDEIEVWSEFTAFGPRTTTSPSPKGTGGIAGSVRTIQAPKRFCFLSKIDLGPELGSARGPLLEFHEGDNHPGSNDRWVNAKDQLSLSLLQARLIDLRMPIKIVEGT